MMDIQNVSKAYGTKNVVHEISLPITEGAITAFIGPNGAGKSTLLSMMSRLIPKDTGEIYVDGNEVKAWKQNELAKKLSVLKQSNALNLKLTVRELVAFGRFPYTKGRLNQNCLDKIEESLDYLGLNELAERDISSLSGGQLQRAYIAMVLAQDTDYILLDEPLNNLDMNYAVQLMKTLQRLVKELHKTIILVIHDINFAASYADEIVAIKNGRLFASGSTEKMMKKEILDDLYEMDIRIIDVEGKKFCLYFND